MKQQSLENELQDISFVMLNSDGFFLALHTQSVLDMQLEENLTRWWSQGYIDISNKFDFIERGAPATGRVSTDSQPSPEDFARGLLMGSPKTEKNIYTFRNDGTDLLFISIQTPGGEKDSFHSAAFMMNIYDIQELSPSDNNETKIKRLFIRDERYQRMLNLNLPWSTTMFTGNTPTVMRKSLDESRSCPTGEAIKQLLILALGPQTIFAPTWDNGSTTTFYTSPANSNVIDDLDYLLRDHVSGEDIGSGRGLLYFDRTFNSWRLVTLDLIFSHAARYDDNVKQYLPGELQSEVFRLSSFPDPPGIGNTKTGSLRIPVGGDKLYHNYNLQQRSQIRSLEFYEINSADNLNNVTTTPVHMHNNKTKKFHIKQSENSIESIYSKVTNIISYMPIDDATDPSISIDINTMRKLNYNIKHVYDTGTDENKSYLNSGINSAVYNSVLLSNAVEFTVMGHPSRMPGRFISIDSETSNINDSASAYHDKVYGQYLTTSVVHRYNGDKYTNKIISVKPYNYKPVHVSEDNTPETVNTYRNFDTDTTTTGNLSDFFSNP